jgi:hypothetical protein
MIPVLAAFDWSQLLGTAASAGTGGLLGLIGLGVSSVVSIYQAREVRAAKREESAARLEELKATRDMNREQAAALFELQKEKGAGEGYVASVNADMNATGASDRVQDIKALQKPAILAYLAIFQLIALVASFWLQDGAAMRWAIVNANVALFSMVISWHHGQRQSGQAVLQVMQPK